MILRNTQDVERWLSGWKPVRKVKPVPLPPLPKKKAKGKR